MRWRRAAALGLAAALLVLTNARAQSAVAPDDPALIRNMAQLCMRAALTSGGVDKATKPYCDCVAPIFARHMTPDSRYALAVQNNMDVRPTYDDDKATFNEVMKTCPPKN
ncbi:MAG TPA: hypothetical protein VH184_09345 [Dongiaceae bacterium]|jgi:hypothetical protein|nr:hypothetical protein [Dongiaceae bacterium]